jgi:adenosylhomocysteine nucleosidase
METSIYQADKELLRLAKDVCEEYLPEIGVHTGRIVSGDQFISDSEKKAWLVRQFGGYCTEMEGAAIGQTAYLNKLPFLIVRAISDKADNSAQMDYSAFEQLAISNTVKLVTGIIARL